MPVASAFDELIASNALELFDPEVSAMGRQGTGRSTTVPDEDDEDEDHSETQRLRLQARLMTTLKPWRCKD